MKSFRIVIHLNVADNFSASFIKLKLAYIRKFGFERLPKALYKLVVAGGSRAGHTSSEAVSFNHFLRVLGGVLAPPIAVEYGTLGSVRISPNRHYKSLLHYALCLILGNIVTDNPPGRGIYYTAYIHLLEYY